MSHICSSAPLAEIPVIPRLSGHKMTLPNPQVSSTCSNWVGSFSMVRVARFELTASWSRTMRATNCATPGYEIVRLTPRTVVLYELPSVLSRGKSTFFKKPRGTSIAKLNSTLSSVSLEFNFTNSEVEVNFTNIYIKMPREPMVPGASCSYPNSSSSFSWSVPSFA